MQSLSRVILFLTNYFTILVLTSMLNMEIPFFQGSIFIITALILGGWLYYLHFYQKNQTEFLKEIIYVMIFLCLVTAIWSFNLEVSNYD